MAQTISSGFPASLGADTTPAVKPVREKLITKSTIKERGWTDLLIARFLDPPDKTAPNPHHRSGPNKMCLYRLDRVEQTETSELFAFYRTMLTRRKEAAVARKEATRQKMITQHAETLAYIDQLRIDVPRIASDALLDRACRHYNNWQQELENDTEFCGETYRAARNSDPLFLQRIIVNYLRHQMTRYDDYLDRITTRSHDASAYVYLKMRVLDAVATAYPDLKEECDRQGALASLSPGNVVSTTSKSTP